jgi:hypothetical protein
MSLRKKNGRPDRESGTAKLVWSFDGVSVATSCAVFKDTLAIRFLGYGEHGRSV